MLEKSNKYLTLILLYMAGLLLNAYSYEFVIFIFFGLIVIISINGPSRLVTRTRVHSFYNVVCMLLQGSMLLKRKNRWI